MDSTTDMLIRLKNAQAVHHERLMVPFSKMKFSIANILKAKGMIVEVERKSRKGRKSEHEYLDLQLKYENGQGALRGVKIISRPSRRLYTKAGEVKPIRSGSGFAIISTPKGVMASDEAKVKHLGGEVICEIW